MRRLIPYWSSDLAAFYAMEFCDTKLQAFLAIIFHTHQKSVVSVLPIKKDSKIYLRVLFLCRPDGVQAKLASAKLQFTKLARKVSTNLGRWLR